MAHDAAYKDDGISAEEAGQILLRNLAKKPVSVNPAECRMTIEEDRAEQHEAELQAPDDDND